MRFKPQFNTCRNNPKHLAVRHFRPDDPSSGRIETCHDFPYDTENVGLSQPPFPRIIKKRPISAVVPGFSAGGAFHFGRPAPT
jgi:hypothetical protein